MNKHLSYEVAGKSYEVEVKFSTQKYVYIRVKNAKIVLSCPPLTSKSTIMELLQKHEKFLKNHLNSLSEEPYIHFQGVSYQPLFRLAKHNQVQIDGQKIIIYATKDDESSYKKSLYDFYKRYLCAALKEILFDVHHDFNDIVIPDIRFRYLKSVYGNYHRNRHLINLSTMLAKFEKKYLKSVLYHELCHVYVTNHGAEFYQIYEKKFPNAKKVQHELRKIKYQDCL